MVGIDNLKANEIQNNLKTLKIVFYTFDLTFIKSSLLGGLFLTTAIWDQVKTKENIISITNIKKS